MTQLQLARTFEAGERVIGVERGDASIYVYPCIVREVVAAQALPAPGTRNNRGAMDLMNPRSFTYRVNRQIRNDRGQQGFCGEWEVGGTMGDSYPVFADVADLIAWVQSLPRLGRIAAAHLSSAMTESERRQIEGVVTTVSSFGSELEVDEEAEEVF